MTKAPLPQDEFARLTALRGLNILDTEPEGAYDDIVKLAARLCQTPIALISLVDERRQWFKSAYGLDVKETPRATAFCDKAILTPTEPLIVVDAKHDPRFADNPLVTGKPNIRFYAGVPLVTKSDQQPIGTLCVIGTQSRELSDEQLETLTVLANHAEKLLHLREATIELLSQQRELQQQQQELTRLGRLSLAGELVAEVSHEISQPLCAITALSATLDVMNEHRGWEYGRTSALVGRLLEACDNARQILSRLRQFNRITPPEFETCDINKILGSTVDFLEFECRRNEVDIKMNLATLPLQVHANNAHLQQVVVNLFINAFEAMSEVAAADRSLMVSSRQEEDLVVVEISDSGPGLTVSDDVAFTAFESTKADGLGMGLSICSRIIEDHSGRISVSSRTGKGATFRIEFPKAG
jgi:signal transduction histidine kinase